MLKTIKVSKRNKVRNPWITSGIINSISHRDRLYNKWKKSTTKTCHFSDTSLYEDYRKYRNNLSSVIKKCKFTLCLLLLFLLSGEINKKFLFPWNSSLQLYTSYIQFYIYKLVYIVYFNTTMVPDSDCGKNGSEKVKIIIGKLIDKADPSIRPIISAFDITLTRSANLQRLNKFTVGLPESCAEFLGITLVDKDSYKIFTKSTLATRIYFSFMALMPAKDCKNFPPRASRKKNNSGPKNGSRNAAQKVVKRNNGNTSNPSSNDFLQLRNLVTGMAAKLEMLEKKMDHGTPACQPTMQPAPPTMIYPTTPILPPMMPLGVSRLPHHPIPSSHHSYY